MTLYLLEIPYIAGCKSTTHANLRYNHVLFIHVLNLDLNNV